jgi:alkylation response protein AidB-like acyl-CoA dehydrogenase
VQFAYNEDQCLLRATVDRFVEARYGLTERKGYRAESAGYSLANWKQLADLGLFALMFSAENAGLGGSARDLAAVMEGLGSGIVVEPILEEIVLAGRIIAELGTPAQRREWLPRIMAGDVHATLAHFEHGARFTLSDVRVQAQPRAGHWLLSGEKAVVPWAQGSGLWIVSARESGEPRDPNGIGFFLVPADAAGIERRDFKLTDGGQASVVHFRGTIAPSRLAGGFEAFVRCVDVARVAAGAEMIGIMSTMLTTTVDYVRTRKQFGAPLASFQALQHRLARLYVRLEQARSQVCRAALAVDHNGGAHASVAGMKSYVGRAAIEIGESCLHLHGGMGMTDELPIGHGFKRLLVLAHLFGDPDTDLTRFARLRSGRGDGETRALAPQTGESPRGS